jgi:biotin carboxyl carrier protein
MTRLARAGRAGDEGDAFDDRAPAVSGLSPDVGPAALPRSAVEDGAVRAELTSQSRRAADGAVTVAIVHSAAEARNEVDGDESQADGSAAAPDRARLEYDGSVLAQRQVLVDGALVVARLESHGRGRHTLRSASELARVILGPGEQDRAGGWYREVLVDGFRFEVEVESARRSALRELATRGRSAAGTGGPVEVRALIPGKVVSVAVAPGDAVEPGQELLVVEAMKMQNELRSPRGGTIDRVGIAPGANIEVGDLLVVISERRPG